MEKISIQTTQNIHLNFQPASLGDRILAFLLDNLIILGYILSIAFIWNIVGFNYVYQVGLQYLFFALIIIPYSFYNLLCEIFFNGQTLGKRQLKIRVICLDGKPAGISNYLLRWLIRPIDTAFYGCIAMVAISANGKGQRLGDMAAGTTVVKLKSTTLENILLKDISNKLVDLESISNYQVTYWQVTVLNDQDMNTIKEVLNQYKKNLNTNILIVLADKLQKHLMIPTEQRPLQFIETVVSDYHYLTVESKR